MTRAAFEALLAQSRPDLRSSLRDIERFLEQWWATTYLFWFTDHGVGHSDRVASALFEILPDDLMPTPNDQDGTPLGRLSVIESYVLVAAALLHDVGMQQLLSEKAAGAYISEDFETIRRGHQEKSGELINARHAEMGIIGTPGLYSAMGLIAAAHGTKTFPALRDRLTNLPLPPGQHVFRAPLLAAILLMADELDLDERRGTLPDAKKVTLSPESRAHHLKHQYVARRSLVREDDGGLTIHIWLDFPKAMGKPDRDLIASWLKVKLLSQIRLVNKTLRNGTGGRLSFSDAVEIVGDTEYYPSRPPIRSDVRRVILAEVDQLNAVRGHEDGSAVQRVRQQSKGALKGGVSPVVAPTRSDQANAAATTLDKFRYLKERGVFDPTLDLFIAVMEPGPETPERVELVRRALDQGADVAKTDRQLLAEYASLLTDLDAQPRER